MLAAIHSDVDLATLVIVALLIAAFVLGLIGRVREGLLAVTAAVTVLTFA